MHASLPFPAKFLLRIATLLMLAITLAPAGAGELPRVKPEVVGMSAEKLKAIRPAVEGMIREHKLAGGIILAARHGKIAYLEKGLKELIYGAIRE